MEKKSFLDDACLTRRQLLLGGGGAVITTLLLPSFMGKGMAQGVPAKLATYPRKKIGRVSRLKQDVPVGFLYPFEDEPLHSSSFLVKLGVPAGGGIGPKSDVVAFNSLCSHMGGMLRTTYYRKDYKAIGPCPNHLTTFDLTRHGIVIAGQATESLPQVVLEVKGDDIYASGMMGLIYGRHNNLRA